nr:uncharacterized protein LOC126536756 isoform X2 [Dermacentor andersoni]
MRQQAGQFTCPTSPGQTAAETMDLFSLVSVALLLAAPVRPQSMHPSSVNAYVDEILEDRLPGEVRSQIRLPAFTRDVSHDSHYGSVLFQSTNVSKHERMKRWVDCNGSVAEFPERVVISCDVRFPGILVHIDSLLTYDSNDTHRVAARIFYPLSTRLVLQFAPWENPSANLTRLSGFEKLEARFWGLDRSDPKNQKLAWGYEKVAKDIVQQVVAEQVAPALGRAAAKYRFPCCPDRP